MSEEDLLEEIQRIASQVCESETKLREKVRKLSNELVEICKGKDFYASSEDVTLWELEPAGDYGIGHFFLRNDEGLFLAYCEPVHDFTPPGFNGSRQSELEYTVYGLNDIPGDSLRKAVAAGNLGELLHNVRNKLSELLLETNHAADLAESCLSNPTLEVGVSFTEVARQINYTNVVQDWNIAVRDITTDPANAITRACSLAESVCKHLLNNLKVELPNEKSIRPLFNTTANALGLAPEEQGDEDLKRLCGGLATVAQHLGALRTKFGTAHGRGPNDTSLTPSHARLAVNAAGNISTFLMEVWQLKKQSEATP